MSVILFWYFLLGMIYAWLSLEIGISEAKRENMSFRDYHEMCLDKAKHGVRPSVQMVIVITTLMWPLMVVSLLRRLK